MAAHFLLYHIQLGVDHLLDLDAVHPVGPELRKLLIQVLRLAPRLVTFHLAHAREVIPPRIETLITLILARHFVGSGGRMELVPLHEFRFCPRLQLLFLVGPLLRARLALTLLSIVILSHRVNQAHTAHDARAFRGAAYTRGTRLPQPAAAVAALPLGERQAQRTISAVDTSLYLDVSYV